MDDDVRQGYGSTEGMEHSRIVMVESGIYSVWLK